MQQHPTSSIQQRPTRDQLLRLSFARLRVPRCDVPWRYDLGRAAVAQQNLLWPPSLVCLAARTLSPCSAPDTPDVMSHRACGTRVQKTGLLCTRFHRIQIGPVFYPVFYPKKLRSGVETLYLLVTAAK